MCGEVDTFSPSSWNQSCAAGTCDRCPSPSFPIPEDREATELAELSLWFQKDVNGRKKYGCWRVEKTIEALSQELEKDIVNMKRHIYTAAIVWEKLRQSISQLRPGKDLITYEDYQRNFELTHMEMQTSMGYAANSIQLGMFPIKVASHLSDQRIQIQEEHLIVVCLFPCAQACGSKLLSIREAAFRRLRKRLLGGGETSRNHPAWGFSIPVFGSRTTETGICSGPGTSSPTLDL